MLAILNKLTNTQKILVLQLCIVINLFAAYVVGIQLGILGSLPFCLGFGILGSSFRALKKEELNILRIGLYGFLMSGLAYLLFVGNILTGDGGGGLLTSNLFPIFNGSDKGMRAFAEMEPATIEDAAKLFIWGFVAGYSEDFVMKIIGRLDKS